MDYCKKIEILNDLEQRWTMLHNDCPECLPAYYLEFVKEVKVDLYELECYNDKIKKGADL